MTSVCPLKSAREVVLSFTSFTEKLGNNSLMSFAMISDSAFVWNERSISAR